MYTAPRILASLDAHVALGEALGSDSCSSCPR